MEPSVRRVTGNTVLDTTISEPSTAAGFEEVSHPTLRRVVMGIDFEEWGTAGSQTA